MPNLSEAGQKAKPIARNRPLAANVSSTSLSSWPGVRLSHPVEVAAKLSIATIDPRAAWHIHSA